MNIIRPNQNITNTQGLKATTNRFPKLNLEQWNQKRDANVPYNMYDLLPRLCTLKTNVKDNCQSDLS